MAGRDVLTTRISDTVKVEIKDPSNPHGTLPNYGNVIPMEAVGFYWSLMSGQSGSALTEQKAINAAARAIRKHAAQDHGVQTAVAHVPASVVEAVNRVREHFGERFENEFYSPNGEAILHYRVDGVTGKGAIHIIPNQASDTLVLIVHTVPGHVQAGVPEAFVSNPMYNTASTLDWWKPEQEEDGGTCAQCGNAIASPDDVAIGRAGVGYCKECDPNMPEPHPNACPACGNLIEDFGALSRFDNKTKICNLCGDAEAMGDFAGVKLLGPGLVDG